MWIYGVGRFSSDLKFMLETNVSWYWKFCWSITPVILTAIFVLAAVDWKTPSYGGGAVHYTDWVHYVGWALTLLVTLQIPIIAVIMVAIYAAKGKARAVVSTDNTRGYWSRTEGAWSRYELFAKGAKCTDNARD